MERKDLLSKVAREGGGAFVGKAPPSDCVEDEGCGGMAASMGGPHRETSLAMLTRAVECQRRKLAGLEHLLRVTEKLENGSPGEEALWKLLGEQHRYLFR